MPIRNLPSPEGADLGRELARFTRAESRKLRDAGADVPDLCGTCAFREGTIPNACGATVSDALKCALEVEAFLCHESPKADGELTGVCSGWAILATASALGGRRVEAPWDYIGGAEGPAAGAGGAANGGGG